MKLSYEDKIKIYQLRKKGFTEKSLTIKFRVNRAIINYIVALINLHGIEIVKKTKNQYYSPQLKLEMINQVLLKGHSTREISLQYGLPNWGILSNWIIQYKKNGYTIVEKKKGRPSKMWRKPKKTWEELTSLEKAKQEIEYLRTEVIFPKKVKRDPVGSKRLTEYKSQKVKEMVDEGFSLKILLKIAQLSRSTYYYHLKKINSADKNKNFKDEIISIYNEHRGSYGYRRITLELKNRGYLVNHKKVKRLMNLLNLIGGNRKRKKYKSYKGEVDKKAPNLINRDFYSKKPLQKCYTDITEFALPSHSQKLYLSAILDGYNSEIISFTISRSPNLLQVEKMLKKAFTKAKYSGTILHSDQGWQYQHNSYHKFLNSKEIKASMSRKGNSPDNGMMESFFGVLKTEMFYGKEHTFKSLEQLEKAIINYIDYYNNKRIKVRLKGLSPVQYRTKFLQ
ncbi:IS3 family transposase [Mycoplasmopsis citelli]|nr:IS3 family transposase [Mycoplasmopsis citelli]